MIGLSPNLTRAQTITNPPPPKGATLSEVVDYYPLAAAQLEIIKKNKIALQKDRDYCHAAKAAGRDSLINRLDMVGLELEIAEGNRLRWYQAPWLWYTAGMVSGILLVSQTLQIAF